MLGFLAYNPVDALGAIELPRGEFLLVFNSLGVYVDLQVRKYLTVITTLQDGQLKYVLSPGSEVSRG